MAEHETSPSKAQSEAMGGMGLVQDANPGCFDDKASGKPNTGTANLDSDTIACVHRIYINRISSILLRFVRLLLLSFLYHAFTATCS